ncbi:enoyl-CoA hydratase [Ornithinimicrobium cryptoxanthini]|uniref:Enoyl-CoA hydratase domain-containing protein 3, mitochondrial n=1 Tax=Ornithinimicrobium cryptoxanthini TaxID=2934161 RepID=A0ABY4YID5_9MICO|nr:enoyl-CoA hydratase [Ornithinimicrobium cryptoxanthini]USQ76463.1 enoyl-CoA hydratase [Ornithinimicrobium cryptoxanthini]
MTTTTTAPIVLTEVDTDSRIVTVTLNRPEKRNALSLALMGELIEVLRDVGSRKDVSVVVLAAAGPVFSAGHDLSEMTGRTVEEYREIFDRCCELMELVQSIPQPVIAQVQGIATAAGCQLAATCDLVVAEEGARFGTPGVKIGLFCSTPMVAISRVIGQKRAMQMLLTGQLVDAPTAADWGLVNEVVPADQLASRTAELAAQIATASSVVTGIGKEAFYAQISRDQHSAYEYAKTVMTMNALATDAQEGICAFLEKRQPTWSDR